uniref:START domain-containing protein n=1 Tax=Amphiprion ocellaris TaxID=80972 RepID=A0A3Q1ARG1_AMPOC
MSAQTVSIPDDRAFASFKAECLCEEGWSMTYTKSGIVVWTQSLEEGKSVHKIKCRMICKDVSAETMYDVLHDIEYRRKWDSNVIETFDIGKLTVNADVGYYSWKCPKPLRNRDVITLRSWLPIGRDYIIMNYSVKHPGSNDWIYIRNMAVKQKITLTGSLKTSLECLPCKPLKYHDRRLKRARLHTSENDFSGSLFAGACEYDSQDNYICRINEVILGHSVLSPQKYPPKKDMVRVVSIQTGYMIQSQGPNHCTLTYMAQVDPRGSLPKWVVNKSSHLLAPRAMKKIHKACLKYQEWKQRHNPGFKPWLYPEQTTLPSIPLSELSIQRAESLENIDESSLAETQEREDSD